MIAGAYAPAVVSLADVWWFDQYAGHGMFVPLFSALMAWSERDRLSAAAGRGESAGALLIAGGLAVLMMGYLTASLPVHLISLVMAMAGTVWLCFGRRCLRAAAFPLMFLVLAAPMPHAIVRAVTLDLQIFAARFAAAGVRLLNIPVYQTGSVLELPSLTLQVAEVCNGLRFLSALVVLTAAFAYVVLAGTVPRIVLSLAAVPIAIFANATRVAAIAVGVQWVGPAAASGPIHNGIGKAVWGVTIGLVVVLGWALRRFADHPAAPGSVRSVNAAREREAAG